MDNNNINEYNFNVNIMDVFQNGQINAEITKIYISKNCVDMCLTLSEFNKISKLLEK